VPELRRLRQGVHEQERARQAPPHPQQRAQVRLRPVRQELQAAGPPQRPPAHAPGHEALPVPRAKLRQELLRLPLPQAPRRESAPGLPGAGGQGRPPHAPLPARHWQAAGERGAQCAARDCGREVWPVQSGDAHWR